jgi:hypothetical protein
MLCSIMAPVTPLPYEKFETSQVLCYPKSDMVMLYLGKSCNPVENFVLGINN